ncbi:MULTISPECIES: hypothetical protein [Streptomyces]|uniref:hypothetical protein n=1 Tax=Streptomyces TaxID=1883 RepID=UPI0003A6148A|nr:MULTISPECIES: hypothetical protein [Streptomyces]MBZ6108150.1 hypothetical protein [Streptomyces olivaceus]MBZ6122034.1 hypothetical protein [Streptomyces olivaceus]MBZ6142855.1 hypothetical protein [Streptomyces olivaceus]MBZ6156695.1 hypothetical protein [Streptomyces olivaceus]MBZ6184491.1 hypothetical protein [Streptomyces olivaceus]
MNIWQPDPDENMVARSSVAFATGAASRVKGMRWFRDTERHDIQHELAGWPAGPSFTPHTSAGSAAQKTLLGAAKVAGVAVMALLSSAGGNVTGTSVAPSEEGKDTPDEPTNEVDDFPVMWAAPMTRARTLPWQLDPGRMKRKNGHTHLIVTDQRLVVVLLSVRERVFEDEVIWECPLTEIEAVTPRNFKEGNDFTITFKDGSWSRLCSSGRQQLMRYLAPPRDLIPLETLPPPQRQAVLDFTAENENSDSAPANITRNPTGRLRAEILLPARLTPAFGIAEVRVTLDAEGRRVDIDDYLPGDF